MAFPYDQLKKSKVLKLPIFSHVKGLLTPQITHKFCRLCPA